MCLNIYGLLDWIKCNGLRVRGDGYGLQVLRATEGRRAGGNPVKNGKSYTGSLEKMHPPTKLDALSFEVVTTYMHI